MSSNENNFTNNIGKLFKLIHPKLRVQKEVLKDLNSIINILGERIVENASYISCKKTLDVRSVESAVKVTLSSVLSYHSTIEGNKAVRAFEERNKKNKQGTLTLSVPRTEKMLRKYHKGSVSSTAAVFLTAVLDFLAADMIELVGRDTQKLTVSSDDMLKCINSDKDLGFKLIKNKYEYGKLEMMYNIYI